MSSTLQIVRDNDTSVVLFDLNDTTGANSVEYGSVQTDLLHNPSFGAPRWDFDRFEPPGIPGGTTTFQRAGLKEMTLGLRIRGTSYDNLTTAVGRLADLLSNGCVMKWMANGSSQIRYIDVEPSPSPVLLNGQELALYQATSLFDTPEGVTLSLTVQPFLRGDALAATTNALINPTLLRDANDDGTPNDWTAGSGSRTIVAADEALSASHTATASMVSQNVSASVGQVWTASVDAKVFSGTGTARLEISFVGGAAAAVSSDTTSTKFTRLTATSTAPASTTAVKVDLRLESPTGTVVTRWRNAQVELASAATPFRVGDETVDTVPTGSGFAHILPVYNPSESPAPCSFTITAPDASSNITDIYMALRSSRRQTGERAMTDFLNGPFYARADATANGWTVTLGSGVTDGGTYADINHATDPTVYRKAVTWTRTTKLDALRGEHDVYARVKAEGAEKFYLQLRWGPNATDPKPYVLNEVTHDVTLATSFGWVMKKLGRIRIPIETSVTLGTLGLELWTHVGTADQDLDVEYLAFVPAETQAAIGGGVGDTRSWLGSELTTPVTNPGGGTAGETSGFLNPATEGIGLMRFEETTDNAGSPPAAGSIIGSGPHISTFNLLESNTPSTIVIRVRNITDSTTTTTRTVDLLTGHQYSENPVTYRMRWTGVAGKTYQLQVDDPSAVGNFVAGLSDVLLPSLQQNEKVRTDPGSVPGRYHVEELSSASALVSDFGASVVPFVIPPGLSLVSFLVLDAALVEYDEPQSVDARTISVAPTIYPRYPV